MTDDELVDEILRLLRLQEENTDEAEPSFSANDEETRASQQELGESGIRRRDRERGARRQTNPIFSRFAAMLNGRGNIPDRPRDESSAKGGVNMVTMINSALNVITELIGDDPENDDGNVAEKATEFLGKSMSLIGSSVVNRAPSALQSNQEPGVKNLNRLGKEVLGYSLMGIGQSIMDEKMNLMKNIGKPQQRDAVMRVARDGFMNGIRNLILNQATGSFLSNENGQGILSQLASRTLGSEITRNNEFEDQLARPRQFRQRQRGPLEARLDIDDVPYDESRPTFSRRSRPTPRADYRRGRNSFVDQDEYVLFSPQFIEDDEYFSGRAQVPHIHQSSEPSQRRRFAAPRWGRRNDSPYGYENRPVNRFLRH